MLLIGFGLEDAEALTAALREMEPGFRVACASDAMMAQPLCEALYEGVRDDWVSVREAAWAQTDIISPRVLLWSGMTGEEQVRSQRVKELRVESGRGGVCVGEKGYKGRSPAPLRLASPRPRAAS